MTNIERALYLYDRGFGINDINSKLGITRRMLKSYLPQGFTDKNAKLKRAVEILNNEFSKEYIKSVFYKHLKEPHSNLELRIKLEREFCISRMVIYSAIKEIIGETEIKTMTHKIRMDHAKRTNLKKYGSITPLMNEKLKRKWRDKDYKKYGKVLSPIERHEMRYGKIKWDDRNDKMLETKRRNGTFNTSRDEEIVYKGLCFLFDKDDIMRQYKSDFYPFRCDFYIKSKDLYIECDFNWTHGEHPFNANCDEDIETIELWIKRANSGKKYYENALQTWVVRDHLKIYHQEKNKLNFKRFYTLKEAKTWINSQK